MANTRAEVLPVLRHIPFILILYFLSFVIIFDRPLDVQQWQWADDALFYNNANAIISHLGESLWLGSFTDVLLAKPPFFPLFIALSISSSIPLRVLEFLLYAPMPFLFLLALRPLKLPAVPLLYFSIICLLFIPAAGLGLRLERTTVSGAMVLFSLISLTALVVWMTTRQEKVWFWALLTGVCIGCAVITREEGIWLFGPVLLALVLICFFSWRLKNKLMVVILFLIAGYQIPLATFSSLNYCSYGVFSTSLRQDPSYTQLYSLLASIEPTKRSKYVPVSTEVRGEVYEISPKFRELEPYLEGPLTDDLATNTRHHKISGWGKKLDVREFFVSTFDWALARSIYSSGNKTAIEFITFCNSATAEIQFAIDLGQIKAGSVGLGVLPPLRIDEITQVVFATYRSIQLLFWPQGIARKYNAKPNNELTVSTTWHVALGTSTVNSDRNIRRLSDIMFNRLLINAFKISYGVIFAAGIIFLIISFRQERQRGLIIFILLAISTGALIAFSAVMGVMDTIAWAILKNPEHYNIMGQFPLHYLLLVSIVAVLHCIQVYRSENRDRERIMKSILTANSELS